MKKREIFVFLSFVMLFLLFAIFQNFSFPVKQLRQLTNKEFFQEKLHKFIPSYSFKEHIGENLEVPYGYKEDLNRRIASRGKPIIFDRKKFLKDGAKNTPIYKDLKDFIDDAIRDSSDDISSAPCVENPIEPKNNCRMQYPVQYSDKVMSTPSIAEPRSENIKVRANPVRQTASISVPGEIYSRLDYDREKNSVNVQFKTNLNKDAGVKVELDSEQKSGSINIDLRW